MFCIHCGANIPDGSAFCLKCGKAVADSGNYKADAQGVKDSFAYRRTGNAAGYDIEDIDPNKTVVVHRPRNLSGNAAEGRYGSESSREHKKESNGSSRLWLWVLIVAVAAAIAVGVVYYITQG